MVWFVLLTIVVFTVGPWAVFNGRLYRKPIFLVIWGLGLALCGGFFSYVLENGASIPVMASLFPELDLSARLVGFTVAATGGSLIASGIVLQTQRLNRTDKIAADRALQAAKELLQSVRDSDAELKTMAVGLSDEEFLERLKAIRRAYVSATEKLVNSMEKVKGLED